MALKILNLCLLLTLSPFSMWAAVQGEEELARTVKSLQEKHCLNLVAPQDNDFLEQNQISTAEIASMKQFKGKRIRVLSGLVL